jgi:hypothetical protein
MRLESSSCVQNVTLCGFVDVYDLPTVSSVVSIRSRSWAGQPRKHGSISGRVKRALLQSVQTLPSIRSEPCGKAAGAWSWPLAYTLPRSRLCGSVPLFNRGNMVRFPVGSRELFCKVSKPCLLFGLNRVAKRPGREADHSPILCRGPDCMGLYLFSTEETWFDFR